MNAATGNVQRELDAFREGIRRRQIPVHTAAAASSLTTEAPTNENINAVEHKSRSASAVLSVDQAAPDSRSSFSAMFTSRLSSMCKTLVLPVLELLLPSSLRSAARLDQYRLLDSRGKPVASDWNFIFASYFLLICTILLLRVAYSLLF